jgi:hypothetical protein
MLENCLDEINFKIRISKLNMESFDHLMLYTPYVSEHENGYFELFIEIKLHAPYIIPHIE